MSYDIYLEISTGKEMSTVVDVGNYTSNVSPMWAKAITAADNQIGGVGIASLGDLHDRIAGDVIEHLKSAIGHMHAHPDDYTPLNPKNGWGDYQGALRYLQALLRACEQHSACTVYISR